MTADGRRRPHGKALLALASAATVLGSVLMLNQESDPPPLKPATVRLDIRVMADGSPDGIVLQRKVRCAGGRRESLRCLAVRTLPGPGALRLGQAEGCEDRDGMASKATIRGRWGTVKIDETLTVADSCQIDRWRRLQTVLGLPAV